ncbi:secreted RxLR effector protein 161-like [Argentina anserina]|uniref:secreted RxLR effector protein 161-like n=1 Tax=Argentina anserina TaxID=57926 RepID=UPI0021764F2E|nr:secreted RxLR effector protein 161-like [Potentilla anserina]
MYLCPKLNKSQCPSNELEREDMKNEPYSRLVGSLIYAQVCTRPDFAYVMGMLARFKSNLGHEHWIAGKKVLRYLQKTKSYQLFYRRVDELEVMGYSNVDFARQYPEPGKSTSGYVFMLVGGTIAWKTVKQTQTATSTMMAEYIAIHEAKCQGLWLKKFLVAN